MLLLSMAICLAATEVRAGDADETAADHVRATDLFPIAARQAVFQYIRGEREGEREIEQVVAPDESVDDATHSEDRSIVTRWRVVTGETRETSFIYDGQDIRVAEQTIYGEHQRIVYYPPVLAVPERLNADATHLSRGKAAIYDTRTGERNYVGDFEHSVQVRGVGTLQLTDGPKIKIVVIRVEHTVDMDLANVELAIETGYALNIGKVYQHVETTVTRMGLFPETDIETIKWRGDVKADAHEKPQTASR